MNQSLKPCPNCGSEAELIESYYLESEKPYSYVHCTNPNCSLHQHNLGIEHFSGEDESHNTEHAVAAWNERTHAAA